LAHFCAISQKSDSIAYIKVEHFKVAKITLGSSLRSALNVFGKPDSVKEAFNNALNGQEKTYWFNGVTIRVYEDKVCGLICTNLKYKTPVGIGIDDTIDKLFSTLGKAEIWQFGGRERVQYFLWPPSDTFMIFEFQEKKISKIILDFIP
jgi:hypothetical protein